MNRPLGRRPLFFKKRTTSAFTRHSQKLVIITDIITFVIESTSEDQKDAVLAKIMHFSPHPSLDQNPLRCTIEPNIFARYSIIQHHTTLDRKSTRLNSSHMS